MLPQLQGTAGSPRNTRTRTRQASSSSALSTARRNRRKNKTYLEQNFLLALATLCTGKDHLHKHFGVRRHDPICAFLTRRATQIVTGAFRVEMAAPGMMDLSASANSHVLLPTVLAPRTQPPMTPDVSLRSLKSVRLKN